MIGQAFQTVLNAVLQVLGLWEITLNRLAGWPYIFGIIVAMLVIRFIVYPFLKVSVADNESSDKVIIIKRHGG